MSVLHATYLRCIKPYINEDTVALEIGAGRGAWTKALLPAKEIWTLDAVSASYSNFYSYIPNLEKIKYLQIEDFNCEELPNNYFDYVFSFGTFCHVWFDGIQEYAINLRPKLKNGANCFWMISDYEKYNEAVNKIRILSIYNRLLPSYVSKYSIVKFFLRFINRKKRLNISPIQPDEDNTPAAGRWYDNKLDRVIIMLETLGYEIIDKDVGTCLRDPIIHFRKTN